MRDVFRTLSRGFLALLFLTCVASAVQACPTCKDSLTENYVQAYGMSIIFMMSMPFLIFGLLSGYFYYEVCKARREQAAGNASQLAADDQMPAPNA